MTHRRPKPRRTPAKKKAHTIAQLLQHADAANTKEEAISFMSQAYRYAPTNLQVIDTFAEYLLEYGESEQAQQMLEQSIQLAPDQNAVKYSNLAECLLQNFGSSALEDALANYRKAEEMLQLEIQATTAGTDARPLSALYTELFSLYMAWVESLLTHGFGDGDEHMPASVQPDHAVFGECERLLSLARGIPHANPESPDLLMRHATIAVLRGRPDEAAAALRGPVSRWSTDTQDIEALPSPGLQFQAARLLLQLDCYDLAIARLRFLLNYDKKDAALWYYLALAHHRAGDGPEADAASCITRCLRILGRSSEVHPLENEIADLAGVLHVPLEVATQGREEPEEEEEDLDLEDEDEDDEDDDDEGPGMEPAAE